MMVNYIIILLVVLILAIGQLLFKTVSNRLGDDRFYALTTDYGTLAIFLTSLAVYGVATIGWIWALRQVPLSTAYLFMSLGFILVPTASHFIFGDPLNMRIAISIVLIISGILVAATA